MVAQRLVSWLDKYSENYYVCCIDEMYNWTFDSLCRVVYYITFLAVVVNILLIRNLVPECVLVYHTKLIDLIQ